MKKIWKAISGKKTNTAAIALIASVIAGKTGAVPEAVISQISGIVEWFGLGLGFVGLLHKWLKR